MSGQLISQNLINNANSNVEDITPSEAGAIHCLQTTLLVSNTTAKEFIDKIYVNTTKNATQVNYLIQTYMPRVMEYHLDLLQRNEVLRRRFPQVLISETLYYLPAGYSVYNGETKTTEINITFDAEFIYFYTGVLIHILNKKMDTLLFGLQDLKQQLGIASVRETYALISELSEEGVAQLTNFAWATKGGLIEEITTFAGSNKPKDNAFPQIPDYIQQALLNVNGTVVQQFIQAKAALKNQLLLDPLTVIAVFQTIPVIEIANVPKLAEIIKKAALIYVQNQPFRNPTALKYTLAYGATPIEGYEREISWLNTEWNVVLQTKTTQGLITNRFLDTVLQLPLLPCSLERLNMTRDLVDDGCFSLTRQEHNIAELARGFDALAAGQSLPELHFSSPAPLLQLSNPAPHSCFTPDVQKVGLGLGIAFVVGLCAYITKSWCGSYRFWSGVASGKKAKTEPAAFAAVEYHAVAVTDTDSNVVHRKGMGS
jgi:hypothetical protein